MTMMVPNFANESATAATATVADDDGKLTMMTMKMIAPFMGSAFK